MNLHNIDRHLDIYSFVSLELTHLSIFDCRHTTLHNSISSHHRRDSTMAALLSGIVVVFILCHSTKIFANTYEAYQVIIGLTNMSGFI